MSESESKGMATNGIGRRAFLRKAGKSAGVAGAAAAIAVTGGAEKAAAAEAQPKTGYRETEHVKRYYAAAQRF